MTAPIPAAKPTRLSPVPTVRFARPIVVPDDDTGTELTVTGVVKPHDDEGMARIDITAVCAGEKVLAQARAVVRAAALPG